MTPHQPEKKWERRQLPENISSGQLAATVEQAALPEEIVHILAARSVIGEAEIENFLNPTLSQLPRPFLMKGMSEAIQILMSAVKDALPVTVYGDFDADGVTATSVLSLFFSQLDVPVTAYIPDRMKEGYGLNSNAVREINRTVTQKSDNPGILITADCGISDSEVVDEAKDLGFKVIVTDHHKPPADLPAAHALINPLQPGCDFPCKNLAGVGVVFYLILGLRGALVESGHWPEDRIPNLKSYMDLVAIGTVADQVPITECNRIIVKAGLQVLNQGNRAGLLKLLENNRGYAPESVTEEDIAFRIAPRINAIGRVGSALKAVDLLTTLNLDNAENLADELEKANSSRKSIEADIFNQASAMVRNKISDGVHSLLLYKNDWHQGVLGIVASRLTEKYHRPAILLTDCDNSSACTEKKMVKGSGRSIEGLDIHKAVSACSSFLDRFGGHEGAVGLTLALDRIEEFGKELDRVIGEQLSQSQSAPRIFIDLYTSPEKIRDDRFLAVYSRLAPFGPGNPEPVFCLKNQKMINLRLVGNNHLRFTLYHDSMSINGIGFGLGDFIETARKSPMDLAFTIKLNSFKGKEKWEIRLVDLRSSAP